MLSFTLDTNCIIAVDEERPEAAAVRTLAKAHRLKAALVGVVAISASERQRDGGTLESFQDFKERLQALDLADLELLEPMMYWDITFWDFGLWSDENMQVLERSIHDILFPKLEFFWQNYCAFRNLDQSTTQPDKKWKNAKCDVQAFWSHAYRKRQVFVTSDMNFHAVSRKARLLQLSGGKIATPQEAVTLLSGAA